MIILSAYSGDFIYTMCITKEHIPCRQTEHTKREDKYKKKRVYIHNLYVQREQLIIF